MNDPIRSMMRKIHGMAARCVLRLASDGLKMQAVQVGVLADETIDDVERVQNYGFTSVPLPGAEGIMLFLGGDRAHGVVIAMDDRSYRLKGLKGGEVALYTDEGDSIVLKRGHIMEATTETFKLTATTGVQILTPAMSVASPDGGAATATFTGSIATTGDVTAGTISLQHHLTTNVEPGSGTSGVPV